MALFGILINPDIKQTYANTEGLGKAWRGNLSPLYEAVLLSINSMPSKLLKPDCIALDRESIFLQRRVVAEVFWITNACISLGSSGSRFH